MALVGEEARICVLLEPALRSGSLQVMLKQLDRSTTDADKRA